MTARMTKMMKMKEMMQTMKLEPGMIVRIQGKRTSYKIVGYQDNSNIHLSEIFLPASYSRTCTTVCASPTASRPLSICPLN